MEYYLSVGRVGYSYEKLFLSSYVKALFLSVVNDRKIPKIINRILSESDIYIE